MALSATIVRFREHSLNEVETDGTVWQVALTEVAQIAAPGGFMSPIPERPRSVHTPDGGVVLDVYGGKMFSLNSTGSLVFQLLEQGASEERVVEELMERFRVSPEIARADVAEFRHALGRFRLLGNTAESVSE
jgi:hypothetical protein